MVEVIHTYPHVPIEEQLRRIERANQGSERKNIIILGAGISGLAAAYVLRQLGHSVKIYEAQDRVGGRIYTYHFEDGQYGELGAMRIPPSHDYTFYFINCLGLETRDFITVFANDQAYLYMRGHKARIDQGQNQIYPLYRISPYERSVYPAGGLFGAGLEQIITDLTYDETKALFEGELINDKMRHLGDTSVGDFVQNLSKGPDSKELIGNFIGLEGWWDKSLTMFIRDQVVDTSDGLQEIIGGTSRLPETLAAQLLDADPNIIKHNVQVTRIANAPDDVEITLQPSDGDPYTMSCDYVLCTIPYTVLRQMDVSGISETKQHAIADMKYGEATKILLHCQERFWETQDGIFGGASVTDSIIRWIYYPSDHADANREMHPRHIRVPRGIRGQSGILRSSRQREAVVAGGPGALLIYVLGLDAIRLAALDPGERAQVAIEHISRVHPQIKDPGMVLGHASMAWDTFKWSAGAFGFLWPNQLLDIYQDAIRPEGRLFFAGEHLSTDQAWIQGALISSLRSVLDIVSYRP